MSLLNEEGNSIRLEMTHVHTVKAIISKPLWRCWSTAVISSVFHIPHLIHLRMPLKEDNGVRATNQPRLHRNSDLRQTIWHRGVNMFCPMLNASACRTCEWANFTTFKRFRRCDLGCFSFFFWRVLCERKEKKNKKNRITAPQVMPSVASSFTCKSVNALPWAHAQILCSSYTIVQLRTLRLKYLHTTYPSLHWGQMTHRDQKLSENGSSG